MKYFSIFLTLSLLTLQLTAREISESKILPWGIDTELVNYPQDEKREKKKDNHSIAQKSCRAMIRFFQVYISPIDGPRSSFYPTSSQYALEAIGKHGVLKGIAMGCDRLMRENGETWVYEVTDCHGTTRKLDPIH